MQWGLELSETGKKSFLGQGMYACMSFISRNILSVLFRSGISADIGGEG